jgi:hypothetical protein
MLRARRKVAGCGMNAIADGVANVIVYIQIDAFIHY